MAGADEAQHGVGQDSAIEGATHARPREAATRRAERRAARPTWRGSGRDDGEGEATGGWLLVKVKERIVDEVVEDRHSRPTKIRRTYRASEASQDEGDVIDTSLLNVTLLVVERSEGSAVVAEKAYAQAITLDGMDVETQSCLDSPRARMRP